MSMDAFAASLGKGASLNRPNMTEAVRTGLIFGLVEAVAPVLGWIVGAGAVAWMADIDHWAAFAILGLLGGRMAFKAVTSRDTTPAPVRHAISVLLLAAIATSLDAMAVGVSLALIQVDIATTAAAIGVTTFLMTTIGTMAGRWTGPMFGRGAELVGGICLISIGVRILIEHTTGG
jgi:putative Mn2+ efflux pump MntP